MQTVLKIKRKFAGLIVSTQIYANIIIFILVGLSNYVTASVVSFTGTKKTSEITLYLVLLWGSEAFLF